MTKKTVHTCDRGFPWRFLLVLAVGIAVSLGCIIADVQAKMPKQKGFASPEEAVKAFIDALKAYDAKALSAILGGTRQLSSGDPVADKAEVERFITAFDEKNSIQKTSEQRAILSVGAQDWPFPMPIVKRGDAWFFDTKAGKEEILNRRIGRNELYVLDVVRAYVDAQREYAGKDRDGDGIYQFAQKFASAPGRKDGLYWETKEGEEESPLGPLMAEATTEGYKLTKRARGEKPSPFHGYYFRILKAQGKHATGGAYDYVVKGKMLLGFGLVAYPAKYSSSGIMTFIVNQEGVVYQKNLGKNTPKIAASMKRYDPDKTWKKVE